MSFLSVLTWQPEDYLRYLSHERHRFLEAPHPHTRKWRLMVLEVSVRCTPLHGWWRDCIQWTRCVVEKPRRRKSTLPRGRICRLECRANRSGYFASSRPFLDGLYSISIGHCSGFPGNRKRGFLLSFQTDLPSHWGDKNPNDPVLSWSIKPI